MKNSITSKKSNIGIRMWAVLFWLFVWHVFSIYVGQEILLVSPVSVAVRLVQLIGQWFFWEAVLFSFLRIFAGFFAATLSAVLFAILASQFEVIQELLRPVTAVMKATPVASFVILALVWIPSRNLSVFISFLMVFPIMYTNVLQGIRSTDQKLLEMAYVFRISFFKKVRGIYVHQVFPYFSSGISVALGLCWKAGIAAEVIGVPAGSIGEMLYNAKVYLKTPDLFAWTVVIVAISMMFEKLFLFVIRRIMKRYERINEYGHRD